MGRTRLAATLTGVVLVVAALPVQATSPLPTLDFGSQYVGTGPWTDSLTLGTATEDLQAASWTVTGSAAFTVDGSACQTLTAGDDCVISADFSPATTGALNASVTVKDAADAILFTGRLTGTGLAPVTADRNTLAFGTTRVGTTSTAKRVTISNPGPDPVSVTPSLAGQYAIGADTCSGKPLPATTGSCTVDVVFAPTTLGDDAETLTLSTDNPAWPELLVALSGTGVQPFGEAAPAALTFPERLVGTTSLPKPVTVSNTGTDALALTGISATGDFQTAGDCAATLAPSASCTVEVTFEPSGKGARPGTLTIAHDGPGTALTVSLSGTGRFPETGVDPGAIDFGTQEVGSSASTRPVVVNNPRQVPLSVGAPTITGSTAFDVAASTCNTPIPPGATCTLRVRFSPAQAGPEQAQLTFDADDPRGPSTVTLRGTGTQAILAVGPAALTFPEQKEGTTSSAQVVTVSNTGSASMAVRSAVAGGTFPTTTNCGVLAAGARCTVEVRFQPGQAGDLAGTLIVRTTAGEAQIPLTGKGLPAIPAKQTPLRPLGLARKLNRKGWTKVMSLPVRTNAGEYAAVTVTPARRVAVRQRFGKLELAIRGRKPATISVTLQAPATPTHDAYSFRKQYRIPKRR